MQNYNKCHENVWILSGTSDGPVLVKKLLDLNYIVFVSVVSYRASQAYEENSKLHIFTGTLSTEDEIRSFIEKNRIEIIIDASHPFAEEISRKLINVSNKISMTLIRYERHLYKKVDKRFQVVSNLHGITGVDLQNKNLLLAIGSRYLDGTAKFYMDLGVNVFARILSTPESISRAFASCIKNTNLAILNPTKIKENNFENSIEFDICKYWGIDYILCRDSGGYPQRLWEQISLSTKIKLFLYKRPKINESVLNCTNCDELINSLKLKKSN